MCMFVMCERAKMPPSAINQHMKGTFSMDESFTLSDMIRLLFHSSFGQRLPNVFLFFFFLNFYIAFIVLFSLLSMYHICTVQKVHINYQNKCAQMSVLFTFVVGNYTEGNTNQRPEVGGKVFGFI